MKGGVGWGLGGFRAGVGGCSGKVKLIIIQGAKTQRNAKWLAAPETGGIHPGMPCRWARCVVLCGAVWCGVVWRGAVWCGVAWRGVVWYSEAWRGVARQAHRGAFCLFCAFLCVFAARVWACCSLCHFISRSIKQQCVCVCVCVRGHMCVRVSLCGCAHTCAGM